MKYLSTSLVVTCLFLSQVVYAVESLVPWGSATEIEQVYSKQKVVFDTAAGTVKGMDSVLDRASYMNKLNGGDSFDTKIVIVLHGDAVNFFASKNYAKYKELMVRAQSLTAGDVIEFRMCKASALLKGLSAKDIHGFVRMVPMADAEIVRLQQEEHFGYMQ
jgi:hypothetical protein